MRRSMQGSWIRSRSGLISLLIMLIAFSGCEVNENVEVDAATPQPSRRQEVAISHPMLVTRAKGTSSRQWDQHIAVPVSIDGGPAMAFLVDTGAARTTIFVPGQVLTVPGVASKFRAGDQVVQGVGGVEIGYRMRVRSFGVGDARVGPFEYVVMADRQDLLTGMTTTFGPVAGILGNDYLSHYRVTIDYQGGKMWLDER